MFALHGALQRDFREAVDVNDKYSQFELFGGVSSRLHLGREPGREFRYSEFTC